MDALKQPYGDELWKKHENAASTTIQAFVWSWTIRKKLSIIRKSTAYHAKLQKASEATVATRNVFRKWVRGGESSKKHKQKSMRMLASGKIQAVIQSWLSRRKLSFAEVNAVKIQRNYWKSALD
jgi:hypothetical protein